MPSDNGIEPALVDELLAFETREEKEEFLRGAGLFYADGLDRLLDVADEQLNNDPQRSRRIAETCAGFADLVDAPAVLPRANYIRAGAHNVNGEFEEDIRLTKAAHDEYVALGLYVEAMRTNVGLMSGLINLGRYKQALDVARRVLDTLDNAVAGGIEISPREARLMVALINQNRGLCYEYMGRYDESLRAFAVTEEIYRDLGMTENVGQILDNRGAVLSALGRGTEALVAHEAAARIFGEAGLTHSQVMSLGNIGETYIGLANYMNGLSAFEQARRLLGSLGASADEYLLLRDTADAYLALNLYPEALAAYREADPLLRAAGMSHDRARALWGMGSALMARLELGKAGEALAEAAKLFSTADNVPMLSGVMLEQATLRAARDDRAAALTMAHRALDLVSAERWPVQQIYARLRVADLLLPDAAAAEPHLLAARCLADQLALPRLNYRLNERLGHVRRLQGRYEEARALLEESVGEIERMRGAVAQDAMRASFLRDKTAAYEELLLLDLAHDDEEGVRRAFDVAERAKSRALVDLLTGVAEKEPMGVADPELEKHIRALQADLNAVYGELLGNLGDEERRVSLPDLRARALELEQEISRLRLQSAAVGHDPDLFSTSGAPVGVQGQISFDAALLAYHSIGDEILTFVCAHGRTRVVRHLATVGDVERLLHRLDVQWERFRAGREFAGRHAKMLERSTQQVLGALYAKLVAPLEPLLGEAFSTSDRGAPVPELTVVPHGLLHRVPFHALFDGDGYLIERFEVSYAPSATVYALCQGRQPSGRNGVAVFGVEDFLIPAATIEARAVAKRLPGAEIHVGEDATTEALRVEAAGSSILHLACHGLFRSDNPMFSALKLHDEWLMAADAMNLDLPGALVTLSACESGRSEVIDGDEILGLTRAFLGAGAATLVVSLWLVQDETTAELMGEYYGLLRAGAKPAKALRNAQLELKKRYAHPYYWSPFVLIGKR